jgi:hypothetical protein
MLILGMMLLIALLGAQELMPFGSLRHSSRCPDGNVRLRWDDLSGGLAAPECYYNLNNGAWQSLTAEEYAPGVMQALAPYEFGQVLRSRLRLAMDYMGESVAFMHSAYWDSNSFPPQTANMALIGSDAAGDSVMVYAPNLDLTDTWIGATSDKIYAAVANTANSFPTLNSLTSYNMWATTLANPEAIADSVAYAMVYTFNIAGLISPGLYKMGMDDTGTPTFARIGNIQSQVSGGKLYLACNLSDLTADPQFGAWPSLTNALAVTSLSMRIDIDFQTLEPTFGLGDYSTLGMVQFVDHRYQASQNSLPEYANFAVQPVIGSISVDYTDANGDFPLIASFQSLLNDAEFEDIELTPLSHDFSQTVTFTGQGSVTPTEGYLRFSDNLEDIVTMHYTAVSAPEDELAPPALGFRMPNPLSPGGGTITVSGLEKAPLRVSLYNLRGQKLADLFQGSPAGTELSLAFDGSANGSPLPSGVYLLKAVQSGRATPHRFLITK